MSMRISELSARPASRCRRSSSTCGSGCCRRAATAATQAEYDEAARRAAAPDPRPDRCRQMPLATVRWVLDIVDNGAARPGGGRRAHDSLPPWCRTGTTPPPGPWTSSRRSGWRWTRHRVPLAARGGAGAVEEVGLRSDRSAWRPTAAPRSTSPASTSPTSRTADPQEAVRYVVVGTVLYEPVLLGAAPARAAAPCSPAARANRPGNGPEGPRP
jgi:hypothetical protein